MLGIVLGLIVVVGVAASVMTLGGDRILVLDRGKAAPPRVLKPVEAGLGDLPALLEAMSHGSAKVRWLH